MELIEIEGGKPLNGEVLVQGSKNAVLPILAACLLASGIAVIRKCPHISDVRHMIEIIRQLGCGVWWEKNDLFIDTTLCNTWKIQCEEAKTMRSSVTFLGSLLGRFQKVEVPYPGGCVIGKRPVDYHIQGLQKLNVVFEESDKTLIARTEGLKGDTITLPYPSVGATQNLMLAAVLAEGTTRIYGCASEPEVMELSNYLVNMGANIRWIADNAVLIEGVKKLHSIEYTVMPDRIVAGTYLAAAVATRGKIMLRNTPWKHLEVLLKLLIRLGVRYRIIENDLLLDASGASKGIDYVKTMPYPGFPTDLQPQLAAVLAVSDSGGVIEETVFESRFAVMEQLNCMGADIEIQDKKILVHPVSKLYGAQVKAVDLRGGAALVVAGLAAEGRTVISGIQFLERGYEDIVRDCSMLGAQMYRITS